jgi:hypothetical protein
VEKPANIEPLHGLDAQRAAMRDSFSPQLQAGFSARGVARARAAYIAICLGEADEFKGKAPNEWKTAVSELQEKHPAVVRDLFHAPKPQADALRERAEQAGLHDPKDFKPTERPLEDTSRSASPNRSRTATRVEKTE